MICQICKNEIKVESDWPACIDCLNRWKNENGMKKKYRVKVIETKIYDIEATKEGPIEDMLRDCNPLCHGIENIKYITTHKEIIIMKNENERK